MLGCWCLPKGGWPVGRPSLVARVFKTDVFVRHTPDDLPPEPRAPPLPPSPPRYFKKFDKAREVDPPKDPEDLDALRPDAFDRHHGGALVRDEALFLLKDL